MLHISIIGYSAPWLQQMVKHWNWNENFCCEILKMIIIFTKILIIIFFFLAGNQLQHGYLIRADEHQFH